MPTNPLRALPAVHDVAQTSQLQCVREQYGHERVVAAVRKELDALRELNARGTPIDGRSGVEVIAARVIDRLARENTPNLRPVINATGIVLHTNLGRAPMAKEAAAAAFEAAQGYVNLEFDLDSGKRSSRQSVIRQWVCQLTGAESATMVNNNAAATVIALRALAQGREVIISRGQLIEIGGSFRIPDIMAVSGAILREVGTTNITRLSDYEAAIGPNTAVILQVHTSNYRVSGFTEEVSLGELVALGKKHGLLVIDDIGSGAMIDFARFGFDGEPIARQSIEAGADLVLFSGDKLLGGPQAGIIVGKKSPIECIERDPLMRAFRCDKMSLAALEATLRLYLNEARALKEVPVLQMLATPLEELQRRAELLAAQLAAVRGVKSAQAREDSAYVGGGSLPDQAMKTWVVEIEAQALSDTQLAQRLRTGTPAVVTRVRDGKVVLDLRTVLEGQTEELVKAINSAVDDSI